MGFLEFFYLSILLVMLLFAIRSAMTIRKFKRQISEITEALSDIKSGNGNRRILVKPHELAAPIAYEINAIVLSYESRLAASRRAEETNRRLMTSLSHDVRTPLTTLIGYLDAVQKGVVAGREREDYLDIAHRKAHDLKDYIDVLFDWFKLNSKEFNLELRTVEAAELTRNILIGWIPIFEEKRMEYIVSIPGQPFPARLDPDGYARILNNLIQNVMMHSHGDRIEIALCRQGDYLKIKLSDNGVGMEREDLEHIFERLYKCDKGRSGKGSGLGLSIARQLVERMDGKITAESTPGNGAAFTLLFPSAEM